MGAKTEEVPKSQKRVRLSHKESAGAEAAAAEEAEVAVKEESKAATANAAADLNRFFCDSSGDEEAEDRIKQRETRFAAQKAQQEALRAVKKEAVKAYRQARKEQTLQEFGCEERVDADVAEKWDEEAEEASEISEKYYDEEADGQLEEAGGPLDREGLSLETLYEHEEGADADPDEQQVDQEAESLAYQQRLDDQEFEDLFRRLQLTETGKTFSDM